MGLKKKDYSKARSTPESESSGPYGFREENMFMFLYGNLSFGIKTGFKIINLHVINHQLNSGSINSNHNWLRNIH